MALRVTALELPRTFWEKATILQRWRDYTQMRAMFLSPPPEFDAVLGVLDAAERTLNAR